MKDDDLKNKLYENALITERINNLTKEEKFIVINKLLENKSQRQLGKELDISHSTINDWASQRQCNKGEGIHVSLAMMARKIESIKEIKTVDRIYIKRIYDACKKFVEK